jgi:hypothetical protein
MGLPRGLRTRHNMPPIYRGRAERRRAAISKFHLDKAFSASAVLKKTLSDFFDSDMDPMAAVAPRRATIGGRGSPLKQLAAAPLFW